MKKIIYCGQFHDLTGYGVAARSYLKALDTSISDDDSVELKIYSSVIQPDNTLDEEYKQLIDKYLFHSQAELEEYISNNDYVCL